MYARTACWLDRHVPSEDSSASSRPRPRGLTQGVVRQGLGGQRAQRNQPGRTGDVRHHEPVQIVYDGARDQLGEGAGVSVVGAIQCGEVAGAVSLEDDRRRVAEADEQQVEHQSSGAAVAVDERVDTLETAVQVSQPNGDVVGGYTGRLDGLPETVGGLHPLVDLGRHVRPGGRHHAARKGFDVVATEGARPFVGAGVRVRAHLPHCGHREVMHVANLGDGHEVLPPPVTGLDCLAVHPASGLAIAQDLEVVAQILGTDGSALVQQYRYFAQYEGVALDGG
jgi:hypothetical protein